MPVENLEDTLPYRAYDVACPVCGNVNAQERLSWDAFRINAQEEDEHPKEIIWKNRAFSHTSPLQFFWASCATCFFTAEIDDKEFRTWEKDEAKYRSSFIEGIFDQHFAALQGPNSSLARLGHDIDPDYPYESILDKFFLGIYSECMKKTPSARDLARFYLRLAWMYRDRDVYRYPDPKPDHEAFLKSLQEDYALLIPPQPSLPVQPIIATTEAQALKLAGKYYATAYNLVREIGVEAELKLFALIGELYFRAYQIDSEEAIFEQGKYYFNAGMKRAMQVLNDKEMDPANKNRARVMLDRIGTRGGKLIQLHRTRTGEPAPAAAPPKKKKGILGGLFS